MHIFCLCVCVNDQFSFVYFESCRQQPTQLVADAYAVEEVSFWLMYFPQRKSHLFLS